MQAINTREKEMPSISSSPDITAKRRKRIITALFLAALIAAAVFAIVRQQAGTATVTTVDTTERNNTANTAAAGTGLPAQAAVNAGQAEAANALLQEVGGQPLSGPVTQRPDFVSPLEWQVLQGVARQHAHPERELTRLVNSLRFNKELELWRSGSIAAGSAAALALEKQLLEEIPARVAQQEMGLAEAQQLQQSLLKDLVPDSEERHQRAEQEASRLGVTFSIKETAAPVLKEAAAPH
jgi:hypothetical protein